MPANGTGGRPMKSAAATKEQDAKRWAVGCGQWASSAQRSWQRPGLREGQKRGAFRVVSTARVGVDLVEVEEPLVDRRALERVLGGRSGDSALNGAKELGTWLAIGRQRSVVLAGAKNRWPRGSDSAG